ncbi:MAG TPA: hypothetical protein VGO62_13855 [Myxococcota bacterium]
MSARGFSLVEVALAAAILLAGITGIASALPQLSKLQEHQRHLADAGTVAGNVIEEAIQKQDLNTLAAGTITGDYDAKGNAIAGGMYHATRTAAFNTPFPGAREIDVLVTWTETLGNKSYSLKTYAYTSP